jgi:hypothetical protein
MRWSLLGIALGLAATIGPGGGGATAAAAEGDSWAPPPPEETWFQVFAGSARVGYAHHKVSRVFGTLIVEEQFQALIKGKVARFDTVVVYATKGGPQPQEATATTALAGVKLMEGKVTFDAKGGEKAAARIQVKGFADRNLKITSPPKAQTSEQPVPDGPVVFQSALPYVAPLLVPKAGRLEGVTLAEFPDDIDFPALLNLKPGRTLERTAPDPTGRWQIVMTAPQRGGPPAPVARMTFDEKGALVKHEWAKFVFQPASQEEALAPVEAAPPPAKDDKKPGA